MRKKILVVDDERTIRMLLENYLGQTYDVTAKSDGLDALNWLNTGNIPDLIIADINMPHMDGFAFVENLRSSGYFKEIPVIMLSASESSTEKVKFLRLGANDYMVKPFNPEELLVRMELLLSRK
jgi:DNA-binding response OmpR family regulator